MILVSYDVDGKQSEVKNRLCSASMGYIKEIPLTGGGVSKFPDTTIVHQGVRTVAKAIQDVLDAAAAEDVKVTRCVAVECNLASSLFLPT